MKKAITFAQRVSTNVIFFIVQVQRQGLENEPTGEGTDGDQIRYKIAVCYRFAGQAEQAIQGFETLLKTHPEGQFASRAYYQIGATYFLTDQFEQSVQFLRGALPRITDTRQHAEAEQLIGLSYLMQKQWSEAGEVFEGFAEIGYAYG